jgi:hypothetical protein
MTAPRTRSVLASDTSAAAEEIQVGRWRAMTVADKAQLVTGLSQAADAMALAGIRHRHPTASARECFLRLAVLKLGVELASRAYPEIADVSDRQWRDVLGIVRVQGVRLDREYLDEGARRLGLEALLTRALQEGAA